jgi:hypothetical protein
MFNFTFNSVGLSSNIALSITDYFLLNNIKCRCINISFHVVSLKSQMKQMSL